MPLSGKGPTGSVARSGVEACIGSFLGSPGYGGITSSEVDRQHHPEARLAGFGGDLNLSPVLVDDDVVCDVQAQARADAGSFRGKEGFEDARLDLRGYPRSVVDDFDRN